jgi:formylglycine-generating enzyme required for sulfatase activity
MADAPVEPIRCGQVRFGPDREIAMSLLATSLLATSLLAASQLTTSQPTPLHIHSPLSHLETVAAVMLMATAVLVLIATNARKAMLARSAMWLSFATVTGATLALFGIYNGGTQAKDQNGKPTQASGSSLAAFTGKLAANSGSNSGSKKRGDIVQDCETCPPLVVVTSGWFMMGASANDSHARPQELPARTVRLTRDFAIGQTEVTVRQFEAFLVGSGHPVPACWSTNSGGANAAATCISWQDANAYVRWLKNVTGRTYRLPTAAEWEYAARAGSGQPYPVASTPQSKQSTTNVMSQRISFTSAPATTTANGPANVAANRRADGVSGASEQNQSVALGSPNYFGLYDVNGGAAELTQDCWTPTLDTVSSEGFAADTGVNCERVIKDGMWTEETKRARFSARRAIPADKALPGVGFRVVRELDLGRN